MSKYKDEVLVELARECNVAQFVSYGPDGKHRHDCICSYRIDGCYGQDREKTISELLEKSIDKSVNIRTFLPDQWSGNPFIVGLKDIGDICKRVDELIASGYYVIVHETIDVCDGGISCVLANGFVEFVPNDTPRFVEKVSKLPIPSLKFEDFVEFVRPVYSGADTLMALCTKKEPTFNVRCDRVEFNLHPRCCGYHHANIIIWEIDTTAQSEYDHLTSYNVFIRKQNCYDWPNAFSNHIGDKVYGLMVARMFHKYVPRTMVFLRSKKVSPFMFGTDTGTGELWTRTCPYVPVPGMYATEHHFTDPYALMESDDPDHDALVSCIVQTGVNAQWSGAYVKDTNQQVAIEGTRSYGDGYMQGAEQDELPNEVRIAVSEVGRKLTIALNADVRFEWVYDGYNVWIVQLHLGAVSSDVKHRVIYQGDVLRFVDYHPEDGLDSLRKLITEINERTGIRVIGNIGLSSHIADVLRKAHVGSFIYVPRDQNEIESN